MESHLLPNNGALRCVLGVSPWRHFAKGLLGEIPFGLMERWLSIVWDPLFIVVKDALNSSQARKPAGAGSIPRARVIPRGRGTGCFNITRFTRF